MCPCQACSAQGTLTLVSSIVLLLPRLFWHRFLRSPALLCYYVRSQLFGYRGRSNTTISAYLHAVKKRCNISTGYVQTTCWRAQYSRHHMSLSIDRGLLLKKGMHFLILEMLKFWFWSTNFATWRLWTALMRRKQWSNGSDWNLSCSSMDFLKLRRSLDSGGTSRLILTLEISSATLSSSKSLR